MLVPGRTVATRVLISFLVFVLVIFVWSPAAIHEHVLRGDSFVEIDEGSEPDLSLLQFEPHETVQVGSLHDVSMRSEGSHSFLTLMAAEVDERDLSARTRLDTEMFASVFLGFWQSHNLIPPPFTRDEHTLWQLWRKHNRCWSSQGQVHLTASYFGEMEGWARYGFPHREGPRNQWVLDLRVEKSLWQSKAEVHCILAIAKRLDYTPDPEFNEPVEVWQARSAHSLLSFSFRLGSSLQQDVFGNANIVDEASSVALMTGPVWGSAALQSGQIGTFVSHVLNRLQPSVWLVYAADETAVDRLRALVSAESTDTTQVRIVHWFNKYDRSHPEDYFDDIVQRAQWAAEQHALRLVAKNVTFFGVMDADERLHVTQHGRALAQGILPAIAKSTSTYFVAWDSIAQYQSVGHMARDDSDVEQCDVERLGWAGGGSVSCKRACASICQFSRQNWGNKLGGHVREL
ncbi:MAG: hypothetical protein MHM6MM_005319 [Cercozoa sp. M6MM]